MKKTVKVISFICVVNCAASLSFAMNTPSWEGGRYQHNSQMQAKGALEVLSKYAFRGDEWVLDVGCGSGKTSAEIAKRVQKGTVVGIDNAPSMILTAKINFKNVPNLHFSLDDATQFCLVEHFDLITSFYTLTWIEDQKSVFANMFTGLKHGGKILIISSGGCVPEYSDIFRKPQWFNHCRALGGGEQYGQRAAVYQRLLAELGFVNIIAQDWVQTFNFESYDALLKWIMAWLPKSTGLLEQEAWIFAHELADLCVGHNGGNVFKMPLVYIEASKQ